MAHRFNQRTWSINNCEYCGLSLQVDFYVFVKKNKNDRPGGRSRTVTKWCKVVQPIKSVSLIKTEILRLECYYQIDI